MTVDGAVVVVVADVDDDVVAVTFTVGGADAAVAGAGEAARGTGVVSVVLILGRGAVLLTVVGTSTVKNVLDDFVSVNGTSSPLVWTRACDFTSLVARGPTTICADAKRRI